MVWAAGNNLVVYLLGNFHLILHTHPNEPAPELGNSIKRIVVPRSIYEYVGVE